jgi:hypothetical protein
MAHYFFNVRNGLGNVDDDEGAELADIDAARNAAIKAIRSILASEVLDGRLDLNGHIEVTDLAGEAVLTVNYRDAIS